MAQETWPRGVEAKSPQTRHVHFLDQWPSHGAGADTLKVFRNGGEEGQVLGVVVIVCVGLL